MRVIFRGLVLLFVVFLLASCKKTLKPEELPTHIMVGNSYYTQFVIRYEKNVHLTTNFRRGSSIPVNTKISLTKITSKTIEVEFDHSAKPLVIKNVFKHTGDDVFQAFDTLFSPGRINLKQFNKLERRNISSGTVAIGMRKKAVTVAIGFPPITETENLNANTWVYWSGRFNKFKVNFSNDKVIDIVD